MTERIEIMQKSLPEIGDLWVTEKDATTGKVKIGYGFPIDKCSVYMDGTIKASPADYTGSDDDMEDQLSEKTAETLATIRRLWPIVDLYHRLVDRRQINVTDTHEILYHLSLKTDFINDPSVMGMLDCALLAIICNVYRYGFPSELTAAVDRLENMQSEWQPLKRQLHDMVVENDTYAMSYLAQYYEFHDNIEKGGHFHVKESDE